MIKVVIVRLINHQSYYIKSILYFHLLDAIDEENDLEDAEEFSDDEFSGEELENDENVLDEDDELSDMSFNSDDDDDQQKQKSKSKNSRVTSSDSIFASAEEFASLLEDEGSSHIAPGGSNAIANKDNACKYIVVYFID